MTTMVSARIPTISQPLEGNPLNQFAATLEHIRVRLARFEARLDERDRWAAAVRPPAQPPPEPDPPVVNTGFHPPHAQPPDPLVWQQMYHNQQLYYNQNLATSTSRQPQPDPASPLGSQSLNQPVIHPPRPPQWGTSTFSLLGAPQPLHNLPEQHIQCQFLAYDQQPTTAWPLHTTLRQLTCRDQPTQRQPLGFQQYDQPLAHLLSCWEPPLTATVAANQPYQSYQPPPPLSRSDRPPQQSSPAPPNAAFEPPLYAASDTYASSSYVLRKNSSWDVLESTQKENFMVDCDRVEEGLDDSTEKNDIDGNLEAGEDDAAEERKTIDKE